MKWDLLINLFHSNPQSLHCQEPNTCCQKPPISLVCNYSKNIMSNYWNTNWTWTTSSNERYFLTKAIKFDSSKLIVMGFHYILKQLRATSNSGILYTCIMCIVLDRHCIHYIWSTWLLNAILLDSKMLSTCAWKWPHLPHITSSLRPRYSRAMLSNMHGYADA